MNLFLKLSLCAILILLILGLANCFFGWYGYEKWKYRRSTRGNIEESKKRDVFLKELNYLIDPIDLKVNFNCYIEKGYKYGLNSMERTKTIFTTNYPFQLSFSQLDTLNDIYYSLRKNTKFDSLDRFCIYLKEPALIYEVKIDIIKNNNDTIGLITIK